MSYVAPPGHVLVRPGLPVDRILASGIHLPAQRKSDHSERDTDGYMKSFAKGEFQVVSGTVVASASRCEFAATMPPHIAMALGLEHFMLPNMMAQCHVRMTPPIPGDKVWFGWRTWSTVESMGHFGFDGDGMIGKIPAGSIYIVKSMGAFRAMGPWIICEPIPQPGGGVITGNAPHVPGAGIARLIGDIHPFPCCHGLEPGETIFQGKRDKTGCPTPFSEREWMRIRCDAVTCINPSWVEVPTDLQAAWEAVDSRPIVNPDSMRGDDTDWNLVDFHYEMEKKRRKELEKKSNRRWWL